MGKVVSGGDLHRIKHVAQPYCRVLVDRSQGRKRTSYDDASGVCSRAVAPMGAQAESRVHHARAIASFFGGGGALPNLIKRARDARGYRG